MRKIIDSRVMVEEAASKHWNVHDNLKGLSIEELREINEKDRLPFAVCAINITGDLNVGIMLRTACVMGAERFFIIGRRKYDKRSTVGAYNYMDVVRVDALDDNGEIDVDMFNQVMAEYGYRPICFETGGMKMFMSAGQFSFKSFYDASEKVCLVFGNEGIGLPIELTSQHFCLSIPQRGVLRSLNVSSAASMAMYEIAKQLS